MKESVAAKLLLKLKSLGVDYIFANPGSEFIPLIEAYEHLPEDQVPRAVTVPHEAQAMAMAYGYYLATGRPQAVMVHVTVGTANALIGLINASRMNIPLLFLAGRTPITEEGRAGHRDRFVHWAQESFDQGAMTREFVKWDYEIRYPESLEPALDRAWSLLNSAPKGPVSVLFSRELLYQTASLSSSQSTPVQPIRPAQSALETVQKWLAESERPVLITTRTGLDPTTVPILEAFAEAHHMPVICPQAQAMNIRTSHKNFCGYAASRALSEADLILVLDTDVPWLPQQLKPKAKIVQVGPDPLFASLPLRSFPSHLNLASDVSEFLLGLAATSRPMDWSEELRSEFAFQQRERRARIAFDAPLAVAGVCEILSEFLDPSIVLINELSLDPELLRLEHSGRYFRSGSASGLGWGLGCALGLKLAKPELLPIAVVGDGVYYLSNPLAAHWSSQAQKLPFLTLVLNNEGLHSIAKSGAWTSLQPTLPFAKIAIALGARAWTVRTPIELKEILPQALQAVRGGEAVLIDARVT